MEFISSVRELPVYHEQGLYILDLDRTLIDDNRQLIDPHTSMWIKMLLRLHDVVICTYRDFEHHEGTLDEIEKLGLGDILGQDLVRSYKEFKYGKVINNVFFATHKGKVIKEFIGRRSIWTDVYFVDDQPNALMEMYQYNPYVKLYLISQPYITVD